MYVNFQNVSLTYEGKNRLILSNIFFKIYCLSLLRQLKNNNTKGFEVILKF